MSGLIGYVGARAALPILIEGLRRLEHRAYDSCGIGLVEPVGVKVFRGVGRIETLIEGLREPNQRAMCGLGHLRWATHGRPTVDNAHPHMDMFERLALVMNGMVANHAPLRERLAAKNYKFAGETDAETLVNLIECVTLAALRADPASFTSDLTAGIRWTLSHAKGEYALALISRHTPDQLFAASMHSPLFVAEALDGALVFSDPTVIPDSIRDVRSLKVGEIAILHSSGKIRILSP